MRKLKRTLGLLLALTILSTCIVFTGISGAAALDVSGWEVLLEADFSGSDLPEGWQSSGDTDIVSISEQSLAFQSTAEKSADVYYNLNDAVDSGIVTVSYKVKPDDINKLAISLEDSDWESAGGTQTNLSTFAYGGAGQKKIAREKAGGTIYNNIAITENTWITAVIQINLNKGSATQMYKNDQGRVIYADTWTWGRWVPKRTAECAKDTLTAVKSIGIEAYSGSGTGDSANYVDDVKILWQPNRTGDVLFDYNFDDMDGIETLPAYGFDFWEAGNYGGVVASDRNQSMRIADPSTNTVRRLWNKAGTEAMDGIYEINFSIKLQEQNSTAIIQLGYLSDPSKDGAKNVIIRTQGGYFYLREEIDGSDTIGCPYEVNEWYDVSCIVNTKLNNYSVTISKDGTALLRRSALRISQTTERPGMIRFRCWDKAGSPGYLIDDFSATDVTENHSQVLLSEDFERYTTVTGGAVYTDLAKSGWSGATEIIEEGTNKYLKLNGDLNFHFNSDAAKSGKVRVKASMKFDEGAIVLGGELLGEGQPESLLGFQACYERIVTNVSGTGDEDKKLVGTLNAGQWYDFCYIVDYETQTYNVGVSTNGTAIAQIRDIPAHIMGSQTAFLTGLKTLRFRTWAAKTGTGYLDNVSIEVIQAEEDSDRTIVYDDFSNLTDDNYVGYEWRGNDGTNRPSYEVSDESHGKSLVLSTIKGSTVSGLYKKLRLTKGQYKVSMAVKPMGANMIASINTIAGKEGGFFFISGNKLYHSALGAIETYYLCDIDASAWTKIEGIINIGKKKITYTIRDENDVIIKKATFDYFRQLSDPSLKIDATIKEIGLRNWSATTEVYVDDFKVAYYPDTPTLTETDIQFTDYADNILSEMVTGVTPLVKSISLNFGCVLDESSLEDAVSLTDGVSFVEYTASISDSIYIMEISKALKANTAYTLRVDPKVASAEGAHLGSVFTLNFTTGSNATVIQLKNLTVSGTAVSKLSEIKAGDVLQVNTDFANCSGSAITLAYSIAYYNEDRLVGVETKTAENIADGTISLAPAAFTVGDLTDVTEINVFLWDNTKDLKAFCTPLVLQ